MGDLRVIQTERDVCRTSVLAALRDALRQAEEGDIVAVAIAVVRPCGALNASFSQAESVGRLLGATEVLKSRMLRSIGELGPVTDGNDTA